MIIFRGVKLACPRLTKVGAGVGSMNGQVAGAAGGLKVELKICNAGESRPIACWPSKAAWNSVGCSGTGIVSASELSQTLYTVMALGAPPFKYASAPFA